MRPSDIEALRAMFADRRRWNAKGVITAVEMASDRSLYRAKVMLQPEGREVIGVVASSGGTGPSAGFWMLPEVGDLVLVEMANGDDDECNITERLSSKEDKIPAQAVPGAAVIAAVAGKKSWVVSDSKINLVAGESDGESPLVLGDVNLEFMGLLLDAFLNAAQIGFDIFSAPVFLDPALRVLLTQYKAKYITDTSTNIVSQLSFTERGGE